ncbi:LPD38 domain-containing protein [Salinisphaera sp. G21_0]|uniref:LPD38 domain-containing protein n=1 Tax=Salinisphaera sp. G21_0 TaxID=2821094 RepID=UPI001ADB341A|nr:LPD38 domain-containing protein [Salinisphaera sp. G21_0]MBO9483807.1 methyltransferase [Salinisphaera sp. G21_0]
MNWEEITRSPQYQQAENDYEREVIRNNFIQQTVDQYGWNEQQAAQFRSEFDKYTAPRGDVYSGELNDAWNSIRSGAASATADMAQFFTGGTPNAVSKGIRGYADDWAEDRSPSTIQAVENFGFGEGQELTGRGFAYGALSGLGSMAPMMAGGGLLGKGLQYGGKALSGYGKAKKALEAADNVTDATAAAGRLAKLDKNIDRASSVLGHGTVGGAMVGGGAGNQTYQEVMALDDQTLLSSKEFQNYYRQTYQETPDNKRQAFDKAKAMLAEDLAAGATAKAGGIGLASMAVLGPQLQKIVTGKGPQGIIKGGAAGAGTEGVQELFEGGGQQWATNTELAGIDGRSQWQDVANVAATGALLGAGSGGAMGAGAGVFSRGNQQPTQEQLAENFTANQRTMAAAEQEISQFNTDIANANQVLAKSNEDIRFLEMEMQKDGADTEFLADQLKEATAARDQAAANIEDRTSRRIGAFNQIRDVAMANARIQQQIKQATSQPQTRPGQNEETQQADWQQWGSDGVDYNRPAGQREGAQGDQFRAPRTNPFNDMGEQRIGRDDGKPFKSMVELQDYADRMKLTRFPFMVQKVNGGYVLVGMPDQVQQQAEQQGAITRINPQEEQQNNNFERVLEGQYIPLSDLIQARQAQQAAQPTLTQQPQQQTAPKAEAELFPYRGAAQEFMQRNGIQGNPVQLDNGLWTIRPQQAALTDESRLYVDRDGRASDNRQNLAEDQRARQHPGYPRESAIQPEPAPQPQQPVQPMALEDQRRTYVDSRGNTADNLQAINQQARIDRESAAAQNHPGYAYTGDDSDYQKYSEKASQLNKLMRKFQGDPRDKSHFSELKQLIQETKRLEKSAMEQAKARRKPIATVNRVSLLQQARAALESQRMNEFNNLMADIRQTNLEEQQRLSGQDSANNTAYDSRLSNQQYREYLEMTAQEVESEAVIARAKAREDKGKAGKVRDDDTLLTAIGRLGGLRTDTVEDSIAESIPVWAKENGKGLASRFVKQQGETMDDMGRILAGYGYFDKNGQEYGANSLSEAIWEEIAGRPRFSQAMGDYSQVAQQQSLRAASGASNVTAPAVRAALAGEPLSPAYRQEVSRILDEAESDPYFDKPEYLNQQAADIDQSRQDNAVTDDWYDRMEPVAIGYADAKTDLDASTFDGEDWDLIETEARELSTLADAQANEQFNQVEEDGDTDQRTSPTVRYGAQGVGRENRQESVQGRQSEEAGPAEQQRGTNPQEVDDFTLTAQTEQELQQQAEQRQAAEAEARQQEEQARQKRDADKEANDFVLSGSDSASDQAAARGQADLLGANSKASESEPNPEPTEAQKQAGNYKKEHIKLQGLDISLENKRGSTRSGTDPDGNEWSVTMAHDYGYIKRTEGADGDHIDVFVGENTDSEQVFIVDQVNKDGSFDEHKVMLGFTDRESAINGYKANYQNGWKVGEVTQTSMGDFKNWLKNGDTTKPASKQQIEVKELSSKVDDDTLNSEYHYKAAQDAFQHSSRNAPQSYREGFIRTVKEVYQAGLEKAETDQQKAALDTAIQQFKADYLEAEKAYFAVRSGVASSHIAGRNNFNSRQAEKRGNADDRALEKLNNRINALKPDVARAVSDARTPEQKQRDTEATEQKRNQQTENKLIEELASYAGLIAAPGMDKNTFRGKALEFLNKLHNHSPEAAQKTMATIEQTLEKVGGYKKVFGGRSNLYKRWQELKGEPAQQSESKTGKPEANKKPRNLKTDSASKVYSNINMGGYSILSDGARVTITGSNGEAIAQIETEDGTIYQQQGESIQGSSVNNAIKKLLSDYFKGKAKPVEDNTEPTPPKGSKPQTESQSEQKSEGQPAKQEAGQRTPDWSKATINEAFDGISSMMDGEMSFPEYQALAQGITGNIDGLRAEFASMTKNKIFGRMGRYFAAFHRDDKKGALVESALETVLNSLKVGKRTSDGPISFEQVIRGEDRIQKRIDAINKVTEDDYKAYLEDRKKQEAEAKQKNEERQKALDNPETLEEYQYFIERKGEDALNPDQMEQLDALITEKRLNKEQEADEKKAEVSGVSGDTAYTTAETTHAKKGIPLFVASLDGRVEREQFNELRNKAKALGGWYSGFNKNGAIPGFQFESDDTRQQFINVLAGEMESSNKLEQKKQTAQEKRLEKLRQMAGEFEQGGEQALNADRKTNTAKRAREAASAWRAAENSIKHGRLLRQIAEATEAGMVKLLSRINANTQLEELLSIRNRLKWNAVWKSSDLVEREPGSADNYQWKEGVTVNQIVADANFDLRVWTSKVKDLLEAMSETKGYKQAAKGMLKAIENYQEDYIDLNHPALWRHIDKLKTFARENRGASSRLQWEAEAVYEPFLKQHRLAQMGITDGASLRFALRELYEVEKGVEAVKRDRLKEMELDLVGRKYPGFFPTPDATIDTLLDHADIQPGMSMLEPSSGKGDIAHRMREANPDGEITVIEIQKGLRDFLEARGFQPEGVDFLEHEGQYDRIVMNPPFEEGQDMVHVQHAYSQLKPGGRLVSVMSATSGDRQRKQDQAFKEWVEDNGGVFEPLPEGSFKSSFRPTGVNTKVLIMDKSEGDSATSDNRYRLNRDNARGINQTTANKAAATIGDQLGVTVNVATNESQLPQHIRNQMEADGVSGVKGIFDNRTGQAWIVSSNLNDEAEAIRTVLHEVAGHQALTQMLGSDMDSIMARIHNDMPADVKARIGKDYASQLKGMDAQTRKAVVAEEYLAHLAETNPTSSTFKRFVSKVRRVLRKLFPNIQWTQDDVVELLEAARKKLKEGGPQGPKGGAKSDSSSTNRYSLAASATQANLSDDVQGVMDKIHGGRQQQVGIVDRVKHWFKDMELASKDAWKAIGDKFYTGMIDQFDPIAKMEKAVNAGKLKEAKDSAYKATLRTKNLDGIMTAVLGKGTPQLKDGSVVVRNGSKGLLEIFEPLAKAGQLEVWETWAAAKRAQRLLNEGRENLFTQADIDTINRHVNARPELKKQFEEAHKQYQAFNKQILDFAQESGLIDPESRKLWETDDYLPFHRVNRLDDGKQSSLLRRKGLSNQQSGIKQLEGGVDQISPMEAIYRNTASLIDASMKNIAMQRISDVGVAAGAMEKTNGGIRLTMDQVKERLVSKGILDEKDTLNQEQKKRWESLLIKFEDMGEGSVKVSRDGKTEVYHVKEGNEDLLETMQAMGPDTLHGILKVFAMPKRLLTSMVTADPGFMARNFVRDTLSTWMTVHPEVGGKTLHASMTEAIANVKKGLESDDHWSLMMAGGGSGGFYEVTPENIRGKLTPGQYKAHHRRVMDNLEQGWQGWQKFGSRFENANRLAVFSAAIDNGASIAEAAHQAQDVLNFTKRGKWQSMRILTEIIPFLNARIQGLDRLVRGGIENPAAMFTRGLIYTAASVALWSLFADDERYKELPDHEKLTWHHVWLPDGNHIRIPKPFEMGAIFATLPEVFNNVAFNGEDGEWAGKMIGKMFTDVFAMGMPQIIAPALDVARNKNSFTDAPILSLGMQYQMPESQYTPWTSETTKALAEAMPDGAPEWMRSPKRLEYLLRGYFGTLGSYALMSADALAREARGAPERPEWSVRHYPVIGSFIRGNDEGATRYSTEMYDLLRESNALASTIKNYTEQGRLEEAAELEREGSEALDSRKELNRYSRQISKLKKEVRKILDSRFMTAPLKKQRIDRLNSQVNDLYEEAIREAGY